jgi:hypothetical protein
MPGDDRQQGSMFSYEEVFGWIFTLTAAVYNLTRLRPLCPGVKTIDFVGRGRGGWGRRAQLCRRATLSDRSRLSARRNLSEHGVPIRPGHGQIRRASPAAC